MKSLLAFLSLVASLAILAGAGVPAAQQEGGFRFRTGVDLINVAATVIDRNGHFVTGLRKEDFAIYEDGKPREIGYFSADRVPVSLGIALDTSGSMEGEKIEHARRALDRFLYDLLDPADVARLGGSGQSACDPGYGVVIGQRYDAQAASSRQSDQLFRGMLAVGGIGVRVQIHTPTDRREPRVARGLSLVRRAAPP